MPQTLISGPHTLADASVARIMVWVMLALTPATLWGFYLFSWPAINLFVVTLTAAVLTEAVCLYLASRAILPVLLDGSALLTAWLLALSLPPWAPWWIGALGAVLAIVVGKQVFGGLGQNLFNPAMVARVALLIAFPLQMTQWVQPAPIFSTIAPGFDSGLAITFDGLSIDAYTGPTLLGHIKTQLGLGANLAELLPQSIDQWALVGGETPGSLGETSALLLLCGGVLLLVIGVINWAIPVSLLFTVALLALAFQQWDPQHYPGISFHLFSGSLMLAAFFIATDMVTSPNTLLGQLLFGVGCGLLIYVIRTWGDYPEGVAFAILLMNALTPVIDHYVRPRIYGRTRSGLPQLEKEQ